MRSGPGKQVSRGRNKKVPSYSPDKLPNTREVKPELLPMYPGKGSPATHPIRLGLAMQTGNGAL